MQVVTISSWLNFGDPAPPWRGSAAGRKFWLFLTTVIADSVRLWGYCGGRAVFTSLWALFLIWLCICLVPGLRDIFHTPVARYSLFVLKKPLNADKPNQTCVFVFRVFLLYVDYIDYGTTLATQQWCCGGPWLAVCLAYTVILYR